MKHIVIFWKENKRDIKTPDRPRLKFPAPHLIKDTSTVLTAAIVARENNPNQGSTQLINNGLKISAKAEELINGFIGKVLGRIINLHI